MTFLSKDYKGLLKIYVKSGANIVSFWERLDKPHHHFIFCSILHHEIILYLGRANISGMSVCTLRLWNSPFQFQRSQYLSSLPICRLSHNCLFVCSTWKTWKQHLSICPCSFYFHPIFAQYTCPVEKRNYVTPEKDLKGCIQMPEEILWLMWYFVLHRSKKSFKYDIIQSP